MYEEFETKTSYKYLQEVIKALDEPVCILGGWAVFFHVNDDFQSEQGRPYLGSRDIDLGFHMDENCSEKDLKNSAVMKALKILKEKMKFKPLCVKAIDKELMEKVSPQVNHSVADIKRIVEVLN